MPKLTVKNAYEVYQHNLPFRIGGAQNVAPIDGPWFISAYDKHLKRVFITLYKYNERWHAWNKLCNEIM